LNGEPAAVCSTSIFGVAQDPSEDIVEVVRDAASEAPTASIFCACRSRCSSLERSASASLRS